MRGGNSQDRRRDRRAAERAGLEKATVSQEDLDEIRTIAASATEDTTDVTALAEDAALDRLDAALEPADENVLRIIFPQDAIEEAAAHLARRARIAEGDEESGDLGAAVRARLENLVQLAYAPQDSAGSAKPGRVAFRLEQIQIEPLVAADLPDELQPGERLPEPNATVELPETTLAPRGPLAWNALFVPEGTLTDDGRAFKPGSLDWRELPLTLMAMIETSAEGGHDGALISGRIDRIWRDGNDIRAAGVFDEGEFGLDIGRMVADGTLRGLSVDIAIHEYEVGPKSDYFDEAGSWLAEKPARVEAEPTLDEILFGGEVEDAIFVVTKGVIGMATVCPFPAFAEANISLAASGAIWSYNHQGGFIVVQEEPLVASAITLEAVTVTPLDEDGEALTAAAAGLAPLHPPVEWFQNPELEELTGVTVDDDGRIYGHAWPWGVCHTGIPEVCTTAPRSNTNYAYFHVGELECAGGDRVAVGRITFDTGHADRRLSRASAAAHYDDTGKIGAFVVCGEDEFGGWISGTLAAGITAEQAQTLRGSAPSGDWRGVNGNLELIALLSVNVPGFPVPRTRALVASGEDGFEVVSLTAAGVCEMLRERTPEDDFREIRALADAARGEFADLAAQARG